jgi:hypothetical protein
MACANNSSQNCGGAWSLNVYQLAPATIGNPSQINGYTAMGCYAEKPRARALKSLFANDSMTVQLCASKASANGAAFFGLEYGRECWYDTVLDGAVAGDPSRCSMNCTGSVFQTCGGMNFMNLYGNVTVPVTSSSSTMASFVSTTSSTTTPLYTSTSVSSQPTLLPSTAPLICPAANGTVYNVPSGGRYMVECGMDRTGKLSLLFRFFNLSH